VSDTCGISITFRKENLSTARRVLLGTDKEPFEFETPSEQETVTVDESQANFGWGHRLEELARRGISFRGSHGFPATCTIRFALLPTEETSSSSIAPWREVITVDRS